MDIQDVSFFYFGGEGATWDMFHSEIVCALETIHSVTRA